MPSPSKGCLVSWQPVQIDPTLFHQLERGNKRRKGKRKRGMKVQRVRRGRGMDRDGFKVYVNIFLLIFIKIVNEAMQRSTFYIYCNRNGPLKKRKI